VEVPSEVRSWLEEFASAVAAQDFARGRVLFDTEVVAYGTRSGVMTSLDRLQREQWGPIWTRTSGFRFSEVDTVLGAPDGWVVAARWQSRSAAGRHRQGRCTLVLTGAPLKCRHSHFSLTPADGGQVDGVVPVSAQPRPG
jgi:hypothetical protein